MSQNVLQSQQKDQNQDQGYDPNSRQSILTPMSNKQNDNQSNQNINMHGKGNRFKERQSPQGRILQQVSQQSKGSPLVLQQNSKFITPFLQNPGSNMQQQILPMTSEQFLLNQTQKFLPRKKKSLISGSASNKITISQNNNNANSNNLPPMELKQQQSNQVSNLASLSPVKIDDKVSKSTSNKAYMIGQQQNFEDSKRIITQQYLKTYSKINTIIKTNPLNEINQQVSSNPTRFGKSNFLPLKENNENKSMSLILNSQSNGGSSVTPDDLASFDPVDKISSSGVQSKLQQHQRNQNFLRKSRNSADNYSSQKIGHSTQNQPSGANYFSLQTKTSRNNPLNKEGPFSQSWTNQGGIGGNGKLFQSLRNELSCIEQDSFILGNYEPAKFSTKRNGIITAYGANTNQGIIRNYNEDRVAIILNIMKPKSKEGKVDYWPKCSFFGIYDGHGGNQCAEFLRDYLHQFVYLLIIHQLITQIIKDDNFPQNPIKAIRNGFREAEKLFLEFAEKQEDEIGDIDRSGSCAIVILIIDETCYVSNVGDSRAIMSADGGERIYALSNDHKPTDEIEMQRIIENGGKIYQNSSVIPHQSPAFKGQQQVIFGPHRVFPGRLSVSRTFGDIEAKLEKYEGNPKVVVAEPDITAFKIRNNFDYILIGCDGIFDKLDNKDCIHLVWQSVQQQLESKQGDQQQQQSLDVHQQCGLGVDCILKTAALRKACDNLTVVMIAFDNFENLLTHGNSKNSLKEEQIEEIMLTPIPEDFDDENKLNDPSSEKPNLKKDDYVLYLDNEEALEGVEGGDLPEIHQVNSDGIPINHPSIHQLVKTSSFKIPTQNILSEISEEDDVSMVSERMAGGALGQGSPQRRSKKASKTNSQQITKQKAIQLLQMNNENSQETSAESSMEQQQQPQQQPANQQDNPANNQNNPTTGSHHEIQPQIFPIQENYQINKSVQGIKSRQKIQDQLKQLNSQIFTSGGSFQGADANIINLINNALQNQKVSTPNGTSKGKNSNSRNGLRLTNSQKAQTQQVNQLLESLNHNSQHMHNNQSIGQQQQQQSIPIIRPTSGGKKRISASNGFHTYKEQRFSNTQNLSQALQAYNTSVGISHLKQKNRDDLPTPSSQQNYYSQQQSQKPPGDGGTTYKRKSSIGSSNAGSRLQKIQIGNPSLMQTQQAYLQKLSGASSSGSQGTAKNQNKPGSGQRWSSLNRISGIAPMSSQFNNGGGDLGGL